MINSINHAFKIINCFTEETQELGIKDMAERLSMNVSTVHHIVSTLHFEGVLVKTQTRRYRLGSKLIRWGRLVSEQYKPYFMTIPYIEKLVKRVDETVHLTIIENDEVSYLAKIDNLKPIHVETNIGTRKPLHCTGAGKAMLAFESRQMIKRILTKGLTPLTAETITDSQSFMKELWNIRKKGYAVDNGEFETGLISVATPIRNVMGDVVCALSVEGSEGRIKANLQTIIPHMLQTASTISKHCDL